MRWATTGKAKIWAAAVFLGLWTVLTLHGQSGPVAPPANLNEAIGGLAARAAVIFAGQVVSIQRQGDVVSIAFRVDQPVYGAASSTYTLREWAGLWPQRQVRYLVGERALVFLHLASAAGFASPVDGSEGVVPIIVQGATAPALLDIRRLASAVLRAPGTPLPTADQGAIQLSAALQTIAESTSPGAPVPRRPLAPTPFPIPLHGSVPSSPRLLDARSPVPPAAAPSLVRFPDVISRLGATYGVR